MNGLRHVSVLRWLFFGLHAALAIAILVRIEERQPRTYVATAKLERNHRLAETDLRLRDDASLAGRYVRETIQSGQPVTEAALSTTPLPPLPAPANTLAALVSMPTALAKQRQIVRGASVSLALRKASAPITGKVLSQECDDTRCTLVIGLSSLPAPTLAADAFDDADVALAGPAKAP